MGRLIQCCGRLAKRPYHFQLGDTRVYSIEEVCYFIAHNIYLLQRDVFGKGFVNWVREELALTELADTRGCVKICCCDNLLQLRLF